MSWDFETVTQQIARKGYRCDAMEWIDNAGIGLEDVSPEEWQQIEKARSERSKILPGARYVKVSGRWDGDFSVFRSRPEINDICQKYDLYQE